MEGKGLVFKYETNYPYSQNIKITILSGNNTAALNFRAPAWLESDMTAAVGTDKYRSAGNGT